MRLEVNPTMGKGGVKEKPPVVLSFDGEVIDAKPQEGRYHKNGKWSYSETFLFVRDCLVLRTLRSTHAAADYARTITVVRDDTAEVIKHFGLNGGWDEFVEFPVLHPVHHRDMSPIALQIVQRNWAHIVGAYRPPAWVIQRWLDNAAMGGNPVPAEFDAEGRIQRAREWRAEKLAEMGEGVEWRCAYTPSERRPATREEIELMLDPTRSVIFPLDLGEDGWEVYPLDGSGIFQLRHRGRK